MPSDEWTKEDWERLNNLAVKETNLILDSAEHPYFAAKNVGIAVLFNLGLLIGRLLLPKLMTWWIGGSVGFDAVELMTYYIIYIIALFFCGFAISYSLYKLFQLKFTKKDETRIDSGFMSGYSAADERNRNYKIWFISSLGGFVNIFLILGLVEIIEAILKNL
jgi:hypothetical protein